MYIVLSVYSHLLCSLSLSLSLYLKPLEDVLDGRARLAIPLCAQQTQLEQLRRAVLRCPLLNKFRIDSVFVARRALWRFLTADELKEDAAKAENIGSSIVVLAENNFRRLFGR